MRTRTTVVCAVAVAASLTVGMCPEAALALGSTVQAVGGNSSGQLGDGTTTDRLTAVQAAGMTDEIAVAAGPSGDHSLAIKSDGTVWAWGLNDKGQLGDGTTTNRSAPVQVSGLTSVTRIAAGQWHSMALKSDGTVWAWGSNVGGELGDGTMTNRSTRVQVSGLSAVTAIAAGEKYGLARKSDGTVWAWGRNEFGEVGDGTTTPRTTPVQVSGLSGAVAVAAGVGHGLAVKSDGTVWAWGWNGNGQLGDGTTTNRTTPVQVSGLTGVVAVAGGHYHGLALKGDGTLWAWGYNGYGQLGDGTTANHTTPVQVSGLTGMVAPIAAGDLHSLAIKSDGTVWAWGSNGSGQLGDGTTTDRSVPTQVSGVTGGVAVSGGRVHSLFLGLPDSDGDGVPDASDQCPGHDDHLDCNTNSVPDCLDTIGGTSADCNTDRIPDECETNVWHGASGGSFTDSANWTPSGIPGIQALLQNTTGTDNSCVLYTPGQLTTCCGVTLQGIAAGRQFLQVQSLTSLRLLSGFATLPRGVLQASPGATIRVDGGNSNQAGEIEIHTAALIDVHASLTNSAGGRITLLDGSLACDGLTNAAGATIYGFGTIETTIANNGDINSIGNMAVVGNLTNNGTVTIQSGILTIIGTLSGSGTVIGGFGGREGDDVVLRVHGDLDLTGMYPRQVDLTSATVQMAGGSADGTQTLEALAPDVGARSVKLPDLALYSIRGLRFGPTPTTVRLVDRHRNSAGAQRRFSYPKGEAVYVGRLILDPGITLDLAGLHLYYGSVQPINPFAVGSGVRVIDSVGGGALVKLDARAESVNRLAP